MSEDRYLTTAEAAHRLDVKPETIYAYASRGLLTSRRGRARGGAACSPRPRWTGWPNAAGRGAGPPGWSSASAPS